MKTRASARTYLVRLTVFALLALLLLACAGGVLLVRQLSTALGAGVRSFRPVASLSCQKYAVTSGPAGTYCAWYVGAATVLVNQAPPEQVFAAYRHQHLNLALGPMQFAIGAVVTEDDNPEPPPLFPVYFGFSLFLEDLP